MKQQGQRGRQRRRRRRQEELGNSGGGVLQENSSPSSRCGGGPNKHSRVSGPPLLLPENRTRNNEDAAIGAATAAAGRSVPLPSPAQRGAEECTNKSIRKGGGGGGEDANDNASPAEVGGSPQDCRPLDDEAQGCQEKRRRVTTTIVSAEEGVDLRWIYCRERGCTFWTRKPGILSTSTNHGYPLMNECEYSNC